MKRKTITHKALSPAKVKADDFGPLIAEVRRFIQSARQAAASTVNTLQVLTNFEIGRRIVEQEQKGEARAGYGTELIKTLSAQLMQEFGKGFSERNLHNLRAFCQIYRNRVPKIWQKPSAKSLSNQGCRKPSKKLVLTGKSASITDPIAISQKPSGKSHNPFTLSWSHYVLLLTIKDSGERGFYEIEAAREVWSVPELSRQLDSGLYERLALSRDKKRVCQLAQHGQMVEQPQDILKEPYVLEFLGLDEKATYSESDLETALINNLEKFLLELGKGFLFEARQKRFTFHFQVVFIA